MSKRSAQPAVSRQDGGTNKRPAPKQRRQLIRWHRRVGLASAFWVFVLSVSGIALNHIDQLYHANEFVSSELLLDWYDIDDPQTILVESSATPSVAWIDGTLVMDSSPLLFNQSTLIGVVRSEQLVNIFTKNALHIYSNAGERVESITYPTGALVEQLWLQQGSQTTVLLQGPQQRSMLNLNSLEFGTTTTLSETPSTTLETTNPAISRNAEQTNITDLVLTPAQDSAIYQQARNYSLLKSKVLLDLHSGRLFGSAGKWVMDFFALCFILLAITGMIVWWRRKAS